MSANDSLDQAERLKRRIAVFAPYDDPHSRKLIAVAAPPMEPEGDPQTFADHVYDAVMRTVTRDAGRTLGELHQLVNHCRIPIWSESDRYSPSTLRALYYRSRLIEVLEALAHYNYVRAYIAKWPTTFHALAADGQWHGYSNEDFGPATGPTAWVFRREPHFAKWPSQTAMTCFEER